MTTATAPAMSEDELMACVVGTKSHPGLARIYAWKIAHFRPAMTTRGMRTPVSADGAGFPDLVMIKQRRLLVVELKSSNAGRIPFEQIAWLQAFRDAGAEAWIWRPEHWHDGTIERELRR